jgi:hypothetical protein
MERDLKIMEEIIKVTSEIETFYPELYKNLEETPIGKPGGDISTADLENYLSTLKWQLTDHIKSKENILSEQNKKS